jgi:hypothetical protein
VYKPGRLHSNVDALTRQLQPESQPAPKYRLLQHVATQTDLEKAEATTGFKEIQCNIVAVASTNVVTSLVTRDEVKQAQADDPDIAPLIEFLVSGVVPPGLTVEALTLDTKGFEVKDGLYRIKPRGICPGRAVIPSTLRKRIIHLAHNDPCSAHFGVRKTKARIQQVAYWKGLGHDVSAYVANCETCALNKHYGTTLKAKLTPLPVPDKPFEYIATDIAHMPVSREAFQYVVGFICHLSKFMVLVPLKGLSAEEVADAYLHQVCRIFGFPRVLLSDNGSNFTADLFNGILSKFETEHFKCVPYFHQTNGLVERAFRTVRQGLRILAEDRESWPEYLTQFALAYNSSEQESISNTPHFAVFGREPRLPLTTMLEEPLTTEEIEQTLASEQNPKTYADHIGARMQAIWDFVREKSQVSKDRMKKQFDQKLTKRQQQTDFKVGDKVIHFASANPPGPHGKMTSHRGPAYIKEVKYPNLLIRLREGGRIMDKTVHISQVRRYHGALSPDSDPDLALDDVVCEACLDYHVPGQKIASWICCDGCSNWYHKRCVTIPRGIKDNQDWFCDECRRK